MKRTEIKQFYASAADFADQTVTVAGWIRTLRDSKVIGFIELNDGSCFKGVQIVFEEAKVANFKEITKLNVGAAVQVTGTLLLTPQAGQPFEINA
ncbi:MAG: asparagine--tRNA ligase, partial [Clostridia bacterium]|nr:asparagine--tRNA ligase [Clostridia bacterium]